MSRVSSKGVEQGVKGVEQGVMQERAKIRAWAKERGIPESDLPFENLGD